MYLLSFATFLFTYSQFWSDSYSQFKVPATKYRWYNCFIPNITSAFRRNWTGGCVPEGLILRRKSGSHVRHFKDRDGLVPHVVYIVWYSVGQGLQLRQWHEYFNATSTIYLTIIRCVLRFFFMVFHVLWKHIFYLLIKPMPGFTFTPRCYYPKNIGSGPTANAPPDKTLLAGPIHFVAEIFWWM